MTNINLNTMLATDANKTLKTKTKRAAALLLMLALLAPAAAWAQTFGGGSGLMDDPYIISTTSHWQQLVNYVGNGNDFQWKYFLLVEDLDFSSTTFQPVGRNSNGTERCFKGNFNGNGHTISNVSFYGNDVTAGQCVGLFGMVKGGRIWNLTLASNSSIIGCNNVGGIVGSLDEGGEVDYCHVEQGVTIGPASIAIQNFGGIVGLCMGGSSISNCTSRATVTNYGRTNIVTLGGIAGLTSGNSSITNCTNYGAVSGTNQVGGITGVGYDITINGCNNYGVVTGSSYVGGIVGRNYRSIAMTNCTIGGDCNLGTEGEEGSSQGTTHGVVVLFDDDVSGNISSTPLITIGQTAYYHPESTIQLSLSFIGTPPEGYVVEDFIADEGTLSPTGNGYSLMLPTSGNVTISGDSPVRDIGYATWVSISVAEQEYTGNVLTPVVTVVDSKEEPSVTLDENVDYAWFTNGDCIFPGNYTVTITGMGDFGGRTTATFHVTASFEGEGTESAPYLIQSTDDMVILAMMVNSGSSFNGEHFSLTTHLDFSGKTYTPVGKVGKPFSGVFNGNAYTISNVSINSSDYYAGLFGVVEYGSLKHILLSSSSIKSYGLAVGGIAGYAINSSIESCIVEADVTIEGHDETGGIVGLVSSGEVSNCSSAATVNVWNQYGGGIVGRSERGTIISCINEGTITCRDEIGGGGIIGCLFDNGLVEGCVNQGNVIGTRRIGGVVGEVIESYVNDNLNLGNVTGEIPSSTGGIVGWKLSCPIFYINNNYWAGNCTVGGVCGDDLSGRAMKGWIVSADEDNLFAQMFPINEEEGTFVGVTHDDITYVGAGETTKLLIEKFPEAPEGIIVASAGILKPLDEEYYDSNDLFYLLTMPSEGGDVNLSIAEGVGLTVAGYNESAKSGWKFIASPVVCDVAAGTVTNIFGASAYDLYRFNQSADLEWENWKAEGNNYHFDLEVGKGYLYANSEDVTLTFTGTLVEGDTYEVTLAKDNGATFAGWNLVGNPFAKTAYIQGNQSFYTMNADGSNLVASTSTSIEAMEGVFVIANTDGETLTFTTNAPNQGKKQIVLNVTQGRGNVIDRAIVRFGQSDLLPKFMLNPSDSKVYIPMDGNNFAVMRSSNSGRLPVCFEPSEDGTYFINVDIENVAVRYLHLIDHEMGTDIDLLREPSYKFDAKAEGKPNRFELVVKTNFKQYKEVFSRGGVSDGFAFISNGEILIDGEGTLQVIDATGRVIHSGDAINRVSTSGMTPGVYVLRLIDGDTIRTQKIVID